MREIISRSEAMAAGLKLYFTGKPCKRGGMAERQTASGRCLCEKCRDAKNLSESLPGSSELRKQRCRKWREQNPNAGAIRRQDESYRAAHRELQRKYYAESRESAISQEKRRAYYIANMGARKAYAKSWRLSNPGKYRAIKARRRAIQSERIPSWYSEFDDFVMSEAAGVAFDRALATGVAHHVDHMVPLMARKASGLHCGANLQVIPAYLNMRKKNKLIMHEPDDWISCL